MYNTLLFVDPTPTELISKLLALSVSDKPPNGEGVPANIPNLTMKRSYALKILACKVAAYLKWDLQLLEKSYVYIIL